MTELVRSMEYRLGSNAAVVKVEQGVIFHYGDVV